MRETLLFSAELRLPSQAVTQAAKVARVEVSGRIHDGRTGRLVY